MATAVNIEAFLMQEHIPLLLKYKNTIQEFSYVLNSFSGLGVGGTAPPPLPHPPSPTPPLPHPPSPTPPPPPPPPDPTLLVVFEIMSMRIFPNFSVTSMLRRKLFAVAIYQSLISNISLSNISLLPLRYIYTARVKQLKHRSIA